MSKTITGNTSYRKSYATQCLISGSTNSRAFDNCFEMGDGDEVVFHIMKRALSLTSEMVDNYHSPTGFIAWDSKEYKERKKVARLIKLNRNLREKGFWPQWLEFYNSKQGK